jgi:hypothetical protein
MCYRNPLESTHQIAGQLVDSRLYSCLFVVRVSQGLEGARTKSAWNQVLVTRSKENS